MIQNRDNVSALNAEAKKEGNEDTFFVRITMMVIFISLFFAVYSKLISTKLGFSFQ